LASEGWFLRTRAAGTLSHAAARVGAQAGGNPLRDVSVARRASDPFQNQRAATIDGRQPDGPQRKLVIPHSNSQDPRSARVRAQTPATALMLPPLPPIRSRAPKPFDHDVLCGGQGRNVVSGMISNWEAAARQALEAAVRPLGSHAPIFDWLLHDLLILSQGPKTTKISYRVAREYPPLSGQKLPLIVLCSDFPEKTASLLLLSLRPPPYASTQQGSRSITQVEPNCC